MKTRVFKWLRRGKSSRGDRNEAVKRGDAAEAVQRWIRDFGACDDNWDDAFRGAFSTAQL